MEKNKILNNRILEIVSGSHLYGTAVETSDKDYVGIFLPPIEYLLGFKKVEEADLSVKSKAEDGKNTQKAIDRKLYEFRKFVQLASENNPNILEILFVNDKNIIFKTEIGQKLLNIKYLFPYKGLKHKFLGYAFAQKHKMIIKKDCYFDLLNALVYLKKFDKKKYLLEVVKENKCPYFIKLRKSKANVNFVSIGDVNFSPSLYVKKVIKSLEQRIAKVGNRKGLLDKYGFDVKFASHLVRLMFEGIELLKTGQLRFPLKEATLLKEIREGKWTPEKVLSFSEELETEIEGLAESSKLPSKPRTKELEKFTIGVLYDHIRKS